VTRGPLRGSFWPTRRQLLILRVIAASDSEVSDLWAELRPQLELERLELGSYDLMPLLYRRLENSVPQDPVLAKLAGIYRKTWYTNQLELSRVAPALAAVVDAGADPLVINGWELVLGYYRDRGVRAVTGLELLVQPDRFIAAERALYAAGWQLDARAASRIPQRMSSIRLVRDVTACVLHRELFHEFPLHEASAIQRLWEAAVALRVEDVEARMLGPANEFLDLCLEGARARIWPNVRWLADALKIARGGELDWDEVVSEGRLVGASLRLHSALVYLRDSLSCAVPPGVISELEGVETNRRERLAHALGAWRGGAVGLAPESLSRYLRATAHENGFRALRRLPAYFRDEWGLRHRRQVPVVAAAKTVERLVSTTAQVVRRPRSVP
jgi:hypothetical protein